MQAKEVKGKQSMEHSTAKCLILRGGGLSSTCKSKHVLRKVLNFPLPTRNTFVCLYICPLCCERPKACLHGKQNIVINDSSLPHLLHALSIQQFLDFLLVSSRTTHRHTTGKKKNCIDSDREIKVKTLHEKCVSLEEP